MVKASATANPSARLVRASARHLHIAPRKARLVTNLVRGLNLMDAIVQLEHVEKKAAGMVIKLLKSAAANAKNNFSLEPEKLYIKSITSDMGKVMKRYFPRARGSAFVIRRKMSHVNVVLEERKEAKKISRSRLELFKKKEEPEASAGVDQHDATNERPQKEHLKQKTFFTEEQRKENRAQQKRRLFDRRGGE
jgi:large subunit ribosomal protein L22